jgi:hypothetical protein
MSWNTEFIGIGYFRCRSRIAPTMFQALWTVQHYDSVSKKL